ncbi:AMP-binding protein [Saccharothrix coeruleofusca]|uniref:AMP-binding protein n=2 Tax=Saccharothrix coeruleofusca TaxID=33919 RepID=A0A918EFM4_9PSEU|nr:AMP-binding protein [Saccharothrix coeruleofusca]
MMIDLTRRANAVELLREHVDGHPEQDALIWVGEDLAAVRRLSWAEVDTEARAIAARLGELFPPGSRALLLYPPVEFIVAFLGCLYAGVVAVPAPLPGRYPHERRRVRGIAADADVSVVLTDTANAGTVREWAHAEGIGHLPVLTTDEDHFGDASRWTAPRADHDTIALLQYTSGSTGDPKGVVVTHGNLLVNAHTMITALEIPADTRFGGWAPHYHDMGLMAQTLPALFLGTTCVLMSATTFLKRPHQWLAMIDRYDIGWSAAPNFGYDLCCRRVTDEQIAGLDLSRWRYAVNGSEPVHVATITAFAERFAAAGFRQETACPCYGLAESTVFVSGTGSRPPKTTVIDPERLAHNDFVPSSTGRALAGNGAAPLSDVRVVDPGTREVLPDGKVGEIWLRGPNVARGYWRKPEATARTFLAETACGDPGFLRTGDLGTVHEGDLYITGRLKDMMIVRGRNLYPQDIEHELRAQHPELGNVGAVFTVDTELVVTHEVQGRQDEAALRDLAQRMKQTVAREFGVQVGGLALLRRGGVRRTTSGKVMRSQMRELFLQSDLDAEYQA